MKQLALVILLICSLNGAFAQAENVEKKFLNRNTIYVNVGYLLVYGVGSINYEHLVPLQSKGTILLKVGMGGFGGFDEEGGYTTFQVGFLSGQKVHHFEISVGLSLPFPKFGLGDEAYGHPYAGSIGWRLQKPNKPFILRVGVGLPEFIYVGAGFSF